MIIASALLLLLTLLGNVLGPVGIGIKSFFLGTFGFSFFAFCLAAIVLGVFLARGIRPSLSKGKIIAIVDGAASHHFNFSLPFAVLFQRFFSDVGHFLVISFRRNLVKTARERLQRSAKGRA